MSDLWVRLVVVGGAALVALLVAVLAHRRDRRTALRTTLDLTGIDGRVVFFTDATCARCDIVRAHLEDLGADFVEIAYDNQPEVHRRVGITGVPLLVIRDERGAEVRRFAGAVGRSRLAIALRS